MYWISPYSSSGMHSSCCAPSELNPCHFVFPSSAGRMWVTIYRACPIALWVYQRGVWCKKCAGTVGTWPGKAGGSALCGGQIQLRREEKKRSRKSRSPSKRFLYVLEHSNDWKVSGQYRVWDRMKEVVKQKTYQLHELYLLPACLLHMHVIFVSRCTTDAC